MMDVVNGSFTYTADDHIYYPIIMNNLASCFNTAFVAENRSHIKLKRRKIS